MARLMLPAIFFVGAAAHGRMTYPVNRLGGTIEVGATNCAMNTGPHPKANMCGYMARYQGHGHGKPGQSLGTKFPPTLCDTKYLTTDMKYKTNGACGTKANLDNQKKPWRSPGTAEVFSPCGVDDGYKGGADGVKLAENKPSTWIRGQSHAVAFTISVNHGGGYSYRVCPKSQHLSEKCFQQNHLTFTSPQHTIKFTNGKQDKIPALHLTKGTYPAGSMWAVMPIPTYQLLNHGVKPPCNGCIGDEGKIKHKEQESNWKFSVMDHVLLPADFPTGGAVLNWRWDNEIQDQVWSNCADIMVTNGASMMNETLVV